MTKDTLTVDYEAFCQMMLERIAQVLENEELSAVERLDEVTRIMTDLADLTQ